MALFPGALMVDVAVLVLQGQVTPLVAMLGS